MTFGERLVELRKSNGYTREAFAEYLGISKYTLRNYELSVNEPGGAFLKRISDIFNVSMDYLMGLTDEPEVLKDFKLRTSEQDMIEKYRDLDSHGKEMVDFTLAKEWERSTTESKIVPISTVPDIKAAHERTDIEITDEMRKHDDDIMNDENF